MLLALLSLFIVAAFAKYKGGADLDPNSDLRIGVKFKPQDCSLTSKNGDSLSMHYTGTLYKDGSEFDSSIPRGSPFDFTLGQGMVIKGAFLRARPHFPRAHHPPHPPPSLLPTPLGWDQGLLGMCVGEKRRLTIPSALGYGASGSGAKIPGGSTLVFEVELLKINGKS